MAKTYKDLVVWQKSVTLVKEIYSATAGFPTEERYGICSQIRRCAVSIPSNIAEGSGRNTTSDYLRFVGIAMGSLFELETQLIISAELGFLDLSIQISLETKIDEIERMLSAMKSSLEARQATQR